MPRQRPVTRELRTIERSFRQLARAFKRIEPALSQMTSGNETKPAVTGQRRKPRLSLKQRQSLKLQGRYMGTMRGLPARKKARVKRVRKAKGIRAAIAMARRLAG